MITCKFVKNPKFVKPEDMECAGPQFEAKRYFVDGRSLLMCERHAKKQINMNPFGGYKFVPSRVRHEK